MSLRPSAKTPEPPVFKLGPTERQTRDSARPRLTSRECEVMHWLSEGKRDREIAVILGLSPRTVEKHVGHILEKLQVETRTAAVSQSYCSGASLSVAVKGSAAISRRKKPKSLIKSPR